MSFSQIFWYHDAKEPSIVNSDGNLAQQKNFCLQLPPYGILSLLLNTVFNKSLSQLLYSEILDQNT